ADDGGPAGSSGRAELELGAVRAEERELGRLAQLDLLDPAPPPACCPGRARPAALSAAKRKRRQQPLTAPVCRAPLHHALTLSRARPARNHPFRRVKGGFRVPAAPAPHAPVDL